MSNRDNLSQWYDENDPYLLRLRAIRAFKEICDKLRIKVIDQ